VPDGPARVSLWRYSPALVLFAIAIADIRQLSDPDLWGHILWGRELLAHGSLPANNVYSYTAPGYHWLRHEWLSQILMSSIFDRFGPFGLKLFKFLCTAATISFIVLAESETAAPAGVQALITLVAALILVPSIQFRPHLFDLLSLSAIIYLLARRNRRGSAPLWIVIPIMAIWSNLHGGFFIGLVAMGVYGAATILEDTYMGRGQRRGLVILAITAAAAASTLCTLLIPPARDTWYTLIYALLDPTTRSNIVDWKPLVASLTTAPAGSLEQKYFATVLLFFAAAIISVILRPKGKDAPLVAVATVLLAALKPGIDASGNPADAVNFMNRHGLAGNVLADYVWGEFVIWHGGPGTKVFIDSRYDLGYPPQVIADFLELDRGKPDAAHTLAAYPTDFVLTRPNYPEAKVMDSQPDWRLIYSDDVARLYARANSPAAHLDGVPFKGTARPTFFP